MANITRWDPFRLEPFDDAIDNLFKGFMVRPFSMGTESPQIKLDVKEDDKAYTVHADIPGVKKEDIHVTIDGNRVSLSAEVRKEKEEKKGETILRSERCFGKVYRAFSLGQEVDEEAAHAKYSDGVLELTLPKKAPVESKRLTIE
ncbi:MAG: Hsp20/alpha crystallin family protein [Burkholderiales bacterium]|nr:Hsp20/alpha crystallin family protein [Burkholderiales bacterium]